MRKGVFIKYFFLISVLIFTRQIGFPQPSDTLYMNAGWQICEKPFASYYRFGKIVIDTSWYYTGRVMDYYMNNTLQMDGRYSAQGEKDGDFWFFYPNGTPKASGAYTNNHRTGDWEYFYPNGKFQMKINYTGDDRNFTVLDFIDSTGKVLTKDSTGRFEMRVGTSIGMGTCRLEGGFKNGKRSGDWRYYAFIPSKNEEAMVIKEIYENGGLKKGNLYSPYSGMIETFKKDRDILRLSEYDKFRATEHFSKDRTSFRNTKDDQDLADFLINKKTPSFDVEGDSFEQSFVGVLKTLNTPAVLHYFNDPKKIYNGEVLINMSDSGDIEEIQITGNLSEKEKEYMLFFFKKFKNIHELMVENVGIDAYHKIYFYSVIFAEFIPNRYLDNFPESQFLFALLPYDKLREAVKEKIKEALKRKGKKEKKN